MTSAYAHETVFPHMHPHPEISIAGDVALSLLWINGIALALYLISRWRAKRAL